MQAINSAFTNLQRLRRKSLSVSYPIFLAGFTHIPTLDTAAKVRPTAIFFFCAGSMP